MRGMVRRGGALRYLRASRSVRRLRGVRGEARCRGGRRRDDAVPYLVRVFASTRHILLFFSLPSLLTTPNNTSHAHYTHRCQKEGQINTCHEVACEPCAVCAEEVALRATGPMVSAELAEAATIAAARDVASPVMSYDDADGTPPLAAALCVHCNRPLIVAVHSLTLTGAPHAEVGCECVVYEGLMQ